MQPVNFILYVRNRILTNGANYFYRKMVRRVDADYMSGRGRLQLQEEMRVDTDYISTTPRRNEGRYGLHIRPRCTKLQEGILPVRLKPHDCISLISTNYQIMCPESFL